MVLLEAVRRDRRTIVSIFFLGSVQTPPHLGQTGLGRRAGPLQPACAFPPSRRCCKNAKASMLMRAW